MHIHYHVNQKEIHDRIEREKNQIDCKGFQAVFYGKTSTSFNIFLNV